MRSIYFLSAFVAMAAIAAFVARNTFNSTGSLADGPTNPSGFTSGPQAGSKVPGPFEPLNINGEKAGEESCLYCRYANAPVAMIFAAKPSEPLAALAGRLEKAAETHKPGSIGACLVVTESNEQTKAALEQLAGKEKLKQVVLAMIEPQGVKRYKLNPEAEVTVLLYRQGVVQQNKAFKAGEWNDKVAAEIGDEAAAFFAAN